MLFLNEYTDAELEQREEQDASPLLANIRSVNEQVTQKVKSAFKTNLRIIKKRKDNIADKMNRTSEDFTVSSTVAS